MCSGTPPIDVQALKKKVSRVTCDPGVQAILSNLLLYVTDHEVGPQGPPPATGSRASHAPEPQDTQRRPTRFQLLQAKFMGSGREPRLKRTREVGRLIFKDKQGPGKGLVTATIHKLLEKAGAGAEGPAQGREREKARPPAGRSSVKNILKAFLAAEEKEAQEKPLSELPKAAKGLLPKVGGRRSLALTKLQEKFEQSGGLCAEAAVLPLRLDQRKKKHLPQKQLHRPELRVLRTATWASTCVRAPPARFLACSAEPVLPCSIATVVCGPRSWLSRGARVTHRDVGQEPRGEAGTSLHTGAMAPSGTQVPGWGQPPQPPAPRTTAPRDSLDTVFPSSGPEFILRAAPSPASPRDEALRGCEPVTAPLGPASPGCAGAAGGKRTGDAPGARGAGLGPWPGLVGEGAGAAPDVILRACCSEDETDGATADTEPEPLFAIQENLPEETAPGQIPPLAVPAAQAARRTQPAMEPPQVTVRLPVVHTMPPPPTTPQRANGPHDHRDQGWCPQGGCPQGRRPQGSVPKAGILKASVSEAGVSEVSVPKAGVSVEGVPKAGVPEAGVLKAGVPKAGISEAGVPKASVSEAGVLKAGVPKTSVSEAGVPKAGVSEASVPKAGVPKVGVSEAGVPKAGVSEASVPKAGVPKVGVSEAGVSKAAVPKVGVSEAGVSKAGVPKVGVSEAGVSKAGAPKAGVSEASVPKAGIFAAGVPKTGVPEAGVSKAGVPKAGVTKAGVSEAGVPKAGVPKAIVSEAGVLEAGVPRVGASEAGVSKAGVPKASISKAGVPKAGVSEVGVSKASISEAGVPKTSISKAGVPKAGVPKASVSEAGVPKAGVSEAGVSKASISEAGVLKAGVPKTNLSKAGVSEAGVPKAGVPKADISEAGVPKARVSEAGVPKAGVPKTNLSKAGVSEAGVPKTAVPEAVPPGKPQRCGPGGQETKGSPGVSLKLQKHEDIWGQDASQLSSEAWLPERLDRWARDARTPPHHSEPSESQQRGLASCAPGGQQAPVPEAPSREHQTDIPTWPASPAKGRMKPEGLASADKSPLHEQGRHRGPLSSPESTWPLLAAEGSASHDLGENRVTSLNERPKPSVRAPGQAAAAKAPQGPPAPATGNTLRPQDRAAEERASRQEVGRGVQPPGPALVAKEPAGLPRGHPTCRASGSLPSPRQEALGAPGLPVEPPVPASGEWAAGKTKGPTGGGTVGAMKWSPSGGSPEPPTPAWDGPAPQGGHAWGARPRPLENQQAEGGARPLSAEQPPLGAGPSRQPPPMCTAAGGQRVDGAAQEHPDLRAPGEVTAGHRQLPGADLGSRGSPRGREQGGRGPVSLDSPGRRGEAAWRQKAGWGGAEGAASRALDEAAAPEEATSLHTGKGPERPAGQRGRGTEGPPRGQGHWGQAAVSQAPPCQGAQRAGHRPRPAGWCLSTWPSLLAAQQRWHPP
ncbi:collagen alpha-1(I) chain [Sus scrofa]|uniref:collagen alpha-1(I) chain n=1 Tax=Sus scrofa TaxID=9823 RepID=UPI000A2B4F53|nr:collagen alpha-1(I) chain [Sus scrofa]